MISSLAGVSTLAEDRKLQLFCNRPVIKYSVNNLLPKKEKFLPIFADHFFCMHTPEIFRLQGMRQMMDLYDLFEPFFSLPAFHIVDEKSE